MLHAQAQALRVDILSSSIYSSRTTKKTSKLSRRKSLSCIRSTSYGVEVRSCAFECYYKASDFIVWRRRSMRTELCARADEIIHDVGHLLSAALIVVFGMFLTDGHTTLECTYTT
ncbi:hypothetical protein BDR05DRAFT_292614 [Suillus weaverae]|nr:hypothetical protein BDR05DRAFT_292614 [Suillus weaverae]